MESRVPLQSTLAALTADKTVHCAVPPLRGSSASRVWAPYGSDVPKVKSQAEIGVGDVCELCRQTVRPASGGAAAAPGASPGWTCACPSADGPMVLQLEDG